jgi:hypothetical protein
VNVFDSLEEAGMGILDATGQATTKVVEKRFGSDVAEIVSSSVSITTDVIQTTSNLKGLAPRNLLKGQAKVAAKSGVF